MDATYEEVSLQQVSLWKGGYVGKHVAVCGFVDSLPATERSFELYRACLYLPAKRAAEIDFQALNCSQTPIGELRSAQATGIEVKLFGKVQQNPQTGKPILTISSFELRNA